MFVFQKNYIIFFFGKMLYFVIGLDIYMYIYVSHMYI